MRLTLDIRGFSTAIVPDQDYADAVCTPSQCPFFYDGECWIYNMGEHPEESKYSKGVGYPPPYGCEAVEESKIDGRMGEYTIVQLGIPDLARIGSPRAARRG